MQSQQIVNDALEALTLVAERAMPRILSQVCRDSGSPFFGCADRNWWHYKMRDFPSVILQQSGATLYAAQTLSSLSQYKGSLHSIVEGSCLFWNKRATKFRAFEEYYPWEEGYPPLAFSTLSVVRMAAESVVSVNDIRPGLQVASQQLLNRFEAQAANQQVAGLAALCWTHVITPDLVSLDDVSVLTEKTLKLQSNEGWFQEYGGPDLGYLSVTIDCLWDAFDATGDARLLQSAEKALDFLDKMTRHTNGESIGMHNARNTDYIVPYGIARFLNSSASIESQKKSLRVLNYIFTKSSHLKHFFSSIDDRYWCHYIGLSVSRSVQYLSSIDLEDLVQFQDQETDVERYFPHSGYIWSNIGDSKNTILISMKKGGNFTIFSNIENCSDFGWVVQSSNKEYVSHWWSNNWQVQKTKEGCIIAGSLFSHVEIQSTPLHHLLLRLASLFMGRRVIGLLKQKFIFKKQKNVVDFKREIFIQRKSIKVVDKFNNLPADCTLKRAPRSSKRHVASADSFHYEDLSLGGCLIREVKEHSSDRAEIVTTYSVG